MLAPGASSSKMQLEQPDHLEHEDAEEDDEVERPGRKLTSQVAEHASTAEAADDAQGSDDSEQAENPKHRHAAEEVEHAAAAAEVGPFRRGRSEAVAEVDQEDERQCDVDVDDEQPALRSPGEHGHKHEVDDREERYREDEELVGGAFEVAAPGVDRGRFERLRQAHRFASSDNGPAGCSPG